MTTTFADIDEAVQYYSKIYVNLPPSIVRDAINYCISNPDKLPDDWEKIDLKKVPAKKKDKEIVIEGAVEIFDSPDDPRIKVIKHRDGATLLTAEEAIELQAKINEALARQEAEKK